MTAIRKADNAEAAPARSLASRLELRRGLSYGMAGVAFLLNLGMFVGLLDTDVVPARDEESPRSRTLWDSGPSFEVGLSAEALAVVDPLVSAALFVLAAAGLAKEALLRGNWLAVVLNIGHLVVCVGVAWVGLEALYWPFEVVL